MSLPWLATIMICSVLIIVLHVIALSLLLKVNVANLSGSQKYLLISLCLTELGFGIVLVLHFIGWKVGFSYKFQERLIIFELTPLYFMYLSIMILLTLDRFLEFRFNIKYFLIRSPKKTLISLSLSLCFSLTIFICLLPFNVDVDKYRKYWLVCIYGPIACIYFLLASLTYYHILKKIKQNRKKSRKLKEHITKDQTSRNRKQIQVYLPSLMILTFILFNIFPMLLLVLYNFVFPGVEWLHNLVMVLFELGWIADPLMYIFTLKSIKRKIQHSFATCKKIASEDIFFTQSGECKKNDTEERADTSHAMQNSSMKKVFLKDFAKIQRKNVCS